MQGEWHLTVTSKPGGAKFLILDQYAENCLYTCQNRYYPFTVVYIFDISHFAGAFQRIDQFRHEQNVHSMVSILRFEPTLFKQLFNMPTDKHPFKPCSCKHKQALTDVLKPISTTSAPAKKNTAVPVNTSVFLPEPNEKLI